MKPLAAALTGTALLALGCSSQPPPEDAAHVLVTKDRNDVKPCIDLARVKTDLKDKPAEGDLKRQTADLGGNVLLEYNEHEGGAFYCKNRPPLYKTPAPSSLPKP